MSSDIAIKVENLGKCYQIYDTPRDRLKQFLVPPLCRLVPGLRRYFPTPDAPIPMYHREFWALKDVSFEIKKGETVGIIGRNGSGKSTLLQLICGTLNPTAGAITVSGRIAALLELGSGFNPEFTGRENVRLTCALLGLTPEETDQRFEEIAAFADIGDFIEQPVKTYSSGMFVRLAFAVNIVSRPDIMVVDEALAVGDIAFQAKCITGLLRLQLSGTTILFVSHDTGAVNNLCSKAIYLENGNIKITGKATKVTANYVRFMREKFNSQEPNLVISSKKSLEGGAKYLFFQEVGPDQRKLEEFKSKVNPFRYGSGDAKILYAELLNENKEPIELVEFGQLVYIVIYFTSNVEGFLTINYYIADENKNFVIGCNPRLAAGELLSAEKQCKYKATYSTTVPLREGRYSIALELARPVVLDETGNFLDVIDDAIVFRVSRRENTRVWSQVYINNEFKLDKLDF